MAFWCIDGIDISGGFLSEVSLNLPRGLTCVIGPRGSGKSTLAEAIRLALSGVPTGASKARLELIKANLSSSTLTLRTGTEKDRGGFTVRRGYGQTPIIVAADGRPITTIDLDRGSFLPIDAYSSLDIEGIADEALGTKRRTLLDDLCANDLERVHLQLSEHRRSLEANADNIKAAEKRVSELTEQIEELGDTQARLEGLPAVSSLEGSPAFQAASRQRQLNEREARGLSVAQQQVSHLGDQLSAATEQARRAVAVLASDVASANKSLVKEGELLLDAFWNAVDRSIDTILKAASAADQALTRVSAALREAHLTQESVYLTLQHENQEAARAFEARAVAERETATAISLAQERSVAEAQLTELISQRRALKAAYVIAREAVSQLREGVANQLQTASGPRVRIRVQRNADNLEYHHQLLEALYGSKLKNQEEILRLLCAIRPDDLGQIVRDNDFAELETHAPLGKERSRKVMDSLRANIDPLALDTLVIDDRVIIELNVSADGAPHFKDAAELSRGQKCTALLPILLARRDTPLLIDQPEDNLDNHFIYQTVVESITRLRNARQMIFITHNANIPVLGEADLVVVMNSDGRRGFVEKTGTVDECRDHIIDLLEGGEEAFDLRRQRYES
jgi:energy-coupling factor transporter ATP-binding protein EcfA2